MLMADEPMEHLNIVENRPRNCHADFPLSATLRIKFDALIHAGKCGSRRCQHPNCGMGKKLFRHFIACRRGKAGGCHTFDTTWSLLLRTQACKQSNCNCRDLPERLMKLRQSRKILRRQVERLGGLDLQQRAGASS